MLTKLRLTGRVDTGINSTVTHHQLVRAFASHLRHAWDFLGGCDGVLTGHRHFADAGH